MITQRKITIPIFDFKLTIVIFDDWRELEGFLTPEEFEIESRAVTVSQYGAALVAVNSKRGSSIVHEAGHIKNAIWRYIGYTPMRDNDEVDQYLVTYIYNKIVDVFYKHNNIKDNLMRDTV